MDAILNTLFLDNPEIPEKIYAFCKTIPEYQKAEQDYYAAEQEISSQLDYSVFNRFDAAQSHYLARLVHAYYLFGLGLRQEVLSALGL